MCFWPQILPHSNVLALTSVIPKRDVNTQYHQKAQLFHIYTVVTENIHLFSLVQQLRLSQKKKSPKTNKLRSHSLCTSHVPEIPFTKHFIRGGNLPAAVWWSTISMYGVCHWHFTDQTVLQKKKEIVLMRWWWWWHTMQWDRDCLFRCVGMLNWYPMWYSRVLPSYLCPAWLSRLSVTNQVDPWTPHIPLKGISWIKAVCELYV